MNRYACAVVNYLIVVISLFIPFRIMVHSYLFQCYWHY